MPKEPLQMVQHTTINSSPATSCLLDFHLHFTCMVITNLLPLLQMFCCSCWVLHMLICYVGMVSNIKFQNGLQTFVQT